MKCGAVLAVLVLLSAMSGLISAALVTGQAPTRAVAVK